MDYKPSSSFEHMIWYSGNLAIWQSGNLAAIWQQSGIYLAIWEWQSCITATSTSMAMVMAIAMAMALCHFEKFPGIRTLLLKLAEDDNYVWVTYYHQEGFPYAYFKENNKT